MLSPILLLFRWASLKEAAAVSALFIFVNSISGLAGLKTWIPLDQSSLVYWLIASLIGGFLGARWGAGVASNTKVKWILALVLVIASVKWTKVSIKIQVLVNVAPIWVGAWSIKTGPSISVGLAFVYIIGLAIIKIC
jgi:hypothetical protein